MEKFKVFVGRYQWHGSYGAYEEADYIFIAESEEVALGLALEEITTSNKDFWEFEEIKTNKQLAFEISRNFS